MGDQNQINILGVGNIVGDVRQGRSGDEIRKCGRCNGTGETLAGWLIKKWVTCPTCKGKGEVRV